MKTEARIHEFLVPEHDYRGRSIPIYFRIPPSLAQDMNYLY